MPSVDSRQRASVDGRIHGDGGAVLVEFALMIPVLAVLLLGMLDFGMGWRQHGYVSSADGNAVRQLASSGNARHADYLALGSYKATMADAQQVQVLKVVVYKPQVTNSTGDPINSGCLTANPSSGGTGYGGACNVYGATQLANLTSSHFDNASDTNCSNGTWDRFWCPTGRKVLQGDPPDFVGVYSEVEYTPFSGLFQNTYVIKDRVVMQIEPQLEEP